jgi:hypothetical protein
MIFCPIKKNNLFYIIIRLNLIIKTIYFFLKQSTFLTFINKNIFKKPEIILINMFLGVF